MGNSIGKRVSRIITNSINNLVSNLENQSPMHSVQLGLQEIDETLVNIRHEIGKNIAKKYLEQMQLKAMLQEHENFYPKINIALTQGREELAKAAIARQIDLESQINVLEKNVSEHEAQEKELNDYLLALNAKKKELLNELKLLKKQQEELNKNQAKVNLESILTMPQSTQAIDGSMKSSLVELESLERETRILERLNHIKNN